MIRGPGIHTLCGNTEERGEGGRVSHRKARRITTTATFKSLKDHHLEVPVDLVFVV